MSWDEKLFGYFYKSYIKSQKDKNHELASLKIEEVARTGEVFLSAFLESPIEIRGSTGWGGWQSNQTLFMPQNYSFLENRQLQNKYWQWRLLLAGWQYQNRDADLSLELLERVLQDNPRLRELAGDLESSLAPLELEAKLGARPQFGTTEESSRLVVPPLSFDRESLSSGTERKGKAKDRAQRVETQDQAENPLTHVFEKVMTAEDYQGGQRRMDGTDEMADHAEALDELNLSHIIRTRQTADSVLKTDSMFDVSEDVIEFKSSNEENTRLFSYPEWFEKNKRYQANWCTVYQKVAKEEQTQMEFNRKIASDLRSRLESIFSAYQWQSRQKEGAELDLPMVLDRYVQTQVGGPSIDCIYKRKIKRNHDFAIQILVDTSLSSDSHVLGRKVIETTQESLNIFADAFKDILDSISIAGFCSQTRHEIRYDIIKDFNENWDRVYRKVAAIKPDGYTRIGPALRHSKYRLDQVKARRKLLLVISDAKPTDYDQYEGRHGLADVRRAVNELHTSGIKTKVLTVTDKRQSHHSQIFGSSNSFVLKDVKDLTQYLYLFWQQAIM